MLSTCSKICSPVWWMFTDALPCFLSLVGLIGKHLALSLLVLPLVCRITNSSSLIISMLIASSFKFSDNICSFHNSYFMKIAWFFAKWLLSMLVNAHIKQSFFEHLNRTCPPFDHSLDTDFCQADSSQSGWRFCTSMWRWKSKNLSLRNYLLTVYYPISIRSICRKYWTKIKKIKQPAI